MRKIVQKKEVKNPSISLARWERARFVGVVEDGAA
jgi:hypothetical protein